MHLSVCTCIYSTRCMFLSLIHTSSPLHSHCVQLRVNLTHPCCHIWYSALKHPGSVYPCSSLPDSVLATFWHDERQLKTALSMARRGQGLRNAAVVLDPQEGWIDENQNQTCLREKNPGQTWEGAGSCSRRGMRLLKNISSVLLLLH